MKSATKSELSEVFVPRSELIILTGYKLPARQIEWLHTRGWTYETDRLGRPKVSKSYLEARMMGKGEITTRGVPTMDFMRR